MVLQLETRLRESLERLRPKEQNSAAVRNSVGSSSHLEVTLQQLLSTLQTQAHRLAKLESGCFGSPRAATAMTSKARSLLPEGGGAWVLEQEAASRQSGLDGLPAALLQVRVALAQVQQRNPPAGEISTLAPHLPSLSSPSSTLPFRLHIFFLLTYSGHVSAERMRPPQPPPLPPPRLRLWQLVLPELLFLWLR